MKWLTKRFGRVRVVCDERIPLKARILVIKLCWLERSIMHPFAVWDCFLVFLLGRTSLIKRHKGLEQ